MSRILRHGLPPQLLDHLLDRVSSRQISADQLGLLADWLYTEPEVPEGKWFKKFPAMTVCGEGEHQNIFAAWTNRHGRGAKIAWNNQLGLSWTNSGFNLWSAAAVTCPFTKNSAATNPYTNSLTSDSLRFEQDLCALFPGQPPIPQGFED